MRGWYSSNTHLCDGELDVHNGLGEPCIGGHQVLDGGVLLNCCICQIVECRSHLLHLFEFGSLVCAKYCGPSHHPIDVAHFSKDSGPMGLPVGPCVVGKQVTFPLAPGQCRVAAC